MQAFDLNARIEEFSDGNFGIVSSVKKAEWATNVCPGTTPSDYITDDYGNPNPNTLNTFQ